VADSKRVLTLRFQEINQPFQAVDKDLTQTLALG
jgi:hypothetical protein